LQEFDFTVAGTAVNDLTIPGPASAPVWVLPGAYDVSETQVPGWVLSNIACDGPATVNVNAGTARVTVAAGAQVKCNFTNNQDGNVGLTKTGDAAAAPVAGDPTRYTISYTVTATNGAFVPKPLT